MFKKRIDSPTYGFYLAHIRSGFDPAVRHFGLHILEDAIKFRWNNFEPNQKKEFKTVMFELYRNVSNQMLGERMLKHVLIAVVERIFRELMIF